MVIFLTPVIRAKINGILNVENPFRTFVESGRVEELPDDYVEEELD
jgi:hypothetical protein